MRRKFDGYDDEGQQQPLFVALHNLYEGSQALSGNLARHFAVVTLLQPEEHQLKMMFADYFRTS